MRLAALACFVVFAALLIGGVVWASEETAPTLVIPSQCDTPTPSIDPLGMACPEIRSTDGDGGQIASQRAGIFTLDLVEFGVGRDGVCTSTPSWDADDLRKVEVRDALEVLTSQEGPCPKGVKLSDGTLVRVG
jgi:hypothetical protein